ncbi:2-hydroxychromene-2-carboxylate isomerase [Alkalilimnicola sp. S0819]|uniref:2-hydroxychromene-2-carboxylate isomerase n=1 Tax=Alkalilimnicola sp. S0819 TaxID=2613922 RepID=UPI001261E4EE|nr:DsbA family protein [Alkalilimnicola sp. S0819]KAB7623349.1 thioredoxin domain-containing protein [Alkalilimnicola sp. S0819]MPQ16888.1 thioredoxin domain-containing protein [Alkalilimnicola sp. S0819]
MVEPVDVQLFFNFRSPYCYLASKRMWGVFDNFHVNLVWRPLGGWSGRSAPERAVKKMPIARQDVARWARRLGVPLTPPPKTTDPTRAGAASLLAEEQGLLREFIIETMRAEWAEGRDIGDAEVMMDVADRVGLERSAVAAAMDDPQRQAVLERNWNEAQERGALGVPSFVIGEEIFWGQDRIDFVEDHLRELRLVRL